MISEISLQNLCSIAERKCRITWINEDTEERIRDIVENGISELAHNIGIKEEDYEDFAKPGSVRKLFENYCMYEWNDMSGEFEKNYKTDIIKARHIYEVKYGKKAEEQIQ